MDREDARIRAIRERTEARRDRFFNARNRTIGVDVDALDMQMAEKEAMYEYETSEIESQVSSGDSHISVVENCARSKNL
jgi:hypothetical protein